MNVFELFATLTLDDEGYKKGLDNAEKDAEGFGSKIKKGFGVATKAIGGALVAGGAAVGALTKQSVEAYADYEQLVGGIETLFGTGGKSLQEFADEQGKTIDEVADEYDMLQKRQTTAMDNAANAYKTAGLSANEYMETVTSFAAALNASLGDEYAWQSANDAHLAVVQMADNANKMGTSMESIQNAYMGFSKQNYTMLDNLKLGYGGTKEEMERLLRDAEELEGYVEGAFDVSNFADIVEAIGIIQDNLGISGTTAKEAASTISGSVAMMKSAWSNLITGMADDEADFDLLIDNMVESVEIAGQNIIPRAEKALNGVASLIEKLAPMIADRLPSLISELLPKLISAATSILNAIIAVLPTIITSLATALIENAPVLIEGIIGLITAIVAALPDLVRVLIEKLPEILTAIAQALVTNVPILIKAVVELVVLIGQALWKLLKKGITMLGEWLGEVWDSIMAWFKELPSKLTYWLGYAIGAAAAFLRDLPSNLWNLLLKLIAKVGEFGANLKERASEMARNFKDNLINGIRELPDKIRQVGQNIIDGLKNGILEKWEDLKNWFSNLGQGLIDGFKNTFKIGSPSKVFAQLGGFMAEGLGIGWEDEFADVKKNIETVGLDMNVKANAEGYTTKSEQTQPTPVNVTVQLQGDANRLFKVIRQENKTNTLATGYNALALL